MSQPNKPNFFLVGEPKCGTTSMHDYLAQHPDIFMSPVKEPHYFGRDFKVNSIWAIRDDQQYQNLFATADGKKRIGESTTWYLYSKTAANEIKTYSSDAKIIAIIRQPVEAIYSLHGHYLYSGQEPITDFRAALAAEKDRRAGRQLVETALFPEAMYYSEVYRYAPQIKRFFDAFGRENVKVILFDEFVSDTPAHYRQTLEFLGVDPSFQADYKIANPAKAVNVPLSQFLLKRPFLRKMIHALVPRKLHVGGYTLLAGLMGKVKRDAKLPADLRAELLPSTLKDTNELEQLLGRDLSHWRR